jgi:Methyltransferase domain
MSVTGVELKARIAAGDVSLFDTIESQTTENDRRSLLALHQALVARAPFVYVEIGSHLGGSLQVFLQDARCSAVVSIDSRPAVQPDERGELFAYPGNTTQRMRELLETRLPTADMRRLQTFDEGSEALEPAHFVALRPAGCFVDAEHTDEAVLRDGRFCRQLVDGNGWVAFHDTGIVFRGLRRFVEELAVEGVEHRVYLLPDSLLVVEFGPALLLETPQVREQVIAGWRGALYMLESLSARLSRPSGWQRVREFARRTTR